MVKARLLVTLEVANTLDILLPRCATKIKVSALAPGAPLIMGLGARGVIYGELPQALHAGATRMLDGSTVPHRTQLVFDVFLADVPKMKEYLAKMRLSDLRAARPAGFEVEAASLALALGESLGDD